MKGDKASAMIELSHPELTLLLFMLEGGAGINPDDPTCEDACPVVEHLEQHLDVAAVSTEKKLVHHLNSHIREGLIECGAFELMAALARKDTLSDQQQVRLREINLKLSRWNCQMKLDEEERRVLRQSLKRLPRTAWLVMPRLLWRLKKKLKAD
jgi:hypothetical protein